MMAIPANRCSRLFHAQIERGTLFRLKDNALFPVLRGEQCTHENRITRIKLQISAGRVEKSARGSSSFHISRLPLAPYFSFLLYILALLITDIARENRRA